jgi:hypothetical protein
MAATATLEGKSVARLTTGDDEFRSKFVSWNLADLTYVDIREYLTQKDSVLVPMASTEQHGPHLPLYTDTITAIEISARISEHIAVLHTPPIWMGYSPQHMHEPGQGRGTITDTPASSSASKITRLAPKSLTFALTRAVASCSRQRAGISSSWAPGAMSLMCKKVR